MQSTTPFGRPENGGVLFKARLVRSSREAAGQRFMFVRVMLGRSACLPSASAPNRPQLLRRSSSIKSACAAGVENAQRIEQFSDAELLEELKRRNVPHTVFCGINHKEELDQLCVERLIAFQIGDVRIEV